jgi:hypothetical protein
VGVVAQPEGEPSVTIESDFVIDCSGLGRVLARDLGLSHVEHRLGDLAVYRSYEGIDWRTELLSQKNLTRTFLTVCPRGWMWFIALSEQLASVELVTRREVLRGGRQRRGLRPGDPGRARNRVDAEERPLRGLARGRRRAANVRRARVDRTLRAERRARVLTSRATPGGSSIRCFLRVC